MERQIDRWKDRDRQIDGEIEIDRQIKSTDTAHTHARIERERERERERETNGNVQVEVSDDCFPGSQRRPVFTTVRSRPSLRFDHGLLRGITSVYRIGNLSRSNFLPESFSLFISLKRVKANSKSFESNNYSTGYEFLFEKFLHHANSEFRIFLRRNATEFPHL